MERQAGKPDEGLPSQTCWEKLLQERTAELQQTNRALQEEIAERKKNEERYRTLIETLPEAILLTDMQQNIRFCNQQAALLFGYETVDLLCEQTLPSLMAPDNRTAPAGSDVPSPATWFALLKNREYTMVRSDGSRFPVEVSSSTMTDSQGEATGMIIVVQDVSERKKLQARVIENERFAASGRLAASVAHEINTPLQSLQTALAMACLTTDAERETILTHAQKEIQRVGRIVRQLLDLYRPSISTFGAVHLPDLVERLMLLIGKRLRDQRVIVRRNLEDNLPAIQGYADELTQVLLNLLINALDAMPDGGELGITVWKQSDEAAICIAISDTGCGIPADLQARMFEPFVTTKDEGTGLGLAISSQIVQQHGGYIQVASTLGRGSTFTLVLPIAQEAKRGR
jgi:signal transduction histidine kinase